MKTYKVTIHLQPMTVTVKAPNPVLAKSIAFTKAVTHNLRLAMVMGYYNVKLLDGRSYHDQQCDCGGGHMGRRT